jgi:sulfite reductase (NADPH) flavoprotein alpha-component
VAALRQRRRADPHRSGLVPRSKEKVYVQDKLREQGAELWRWINDGAHIYVCGDANRMAKDVEQTLLEVIAEFGAMDAEAADDF